MVSEMCSGWRGTHRDLHNGQEDLCSDLQEVQGVPEKGMKGWARKMAVALPLFPISIKKGQQEGKRNGSSLAPLCQPIFWAIISPAQNATCHSISAVK